MGEAASSSSSSSSSSSAAAALRWNLVTELPLRRRQIPADEVYMVFNFIYPSLDPDFNHRFIFKLMPSKKKSSKSTKAVTEEKDSPFWDTLRRIRSKLVTLIIYTLINPVFLPNPSVDAVFPMVGAWSWYDPMRRKADPADLDNLPADMFSSIISSTALVDFVGGEAAAKFWSPESMAKLFSNMVGRKLCSDERIIKFTIEIMCGGEGGVTPPCRGRRPADLILVSCKTWSPSMHWPCSVFTYDERTKLVLGSVKDRSCSICFNDYDNDNDNDDDPEDEEEEVRMMTILPCEHAFHYVCIMEWAKYSNACPWPGCGSHLPEYHQRRHWLPPPPHCSRPLLCDLILILLTIFVFSMLLSEFWRTLKFT